VQVKLHAVPPYQDMVTGYFTSRCGLSGRKGGSLLPLPKGAHERYMSGPTEFYEAPSESKITCAKCKLKLSKDVKKLLSIMVAKPEWRYKIGPVDANVELGRLWLPKEALSFMRVNGLAAKLKRGDILILTYNGKDLASKRPRRRT
jgi:hypothetical protein